MKERKFVKIRCECGHLNLIPVYEVFHVYETFDVSNEEEL